VTAADEWVDGWSLRSDILSEAKRWGLNLDSHEKLQVYDNSDFRLCLTYPEKLILPSSIGLF